MKSFTEERSYVDKKRTPKQAPRGEGQTSRKPVSTHIETKQRIEKRTRTIQYVTDRPVDVWDVLSFGISRLVRNNRIETTEYETEYVTVDYDVEVTDYEDVITPAPTVWYNHVIEYQVKSQRKITWDFTATLPIDYKDNFDIQKPGRTTGSWGEVSREIISESDEGL
jgi:hypothetical protein